MWRLTSLHPPVRRVIWNPASIPASPSSMLLLVTSASPGMPDAAISAWNESASEPKVTAQPWPIEGMRMAAVPENPRLARRGAVIATGTPNPPTPCRKVANTQPMISAWSVLSEVSRGSVLASDRIAPASSVTRKRRKAPQTMRRISRIMKAALRCAVSRSRGPAAKAWCAMRRAASQPARPALEAPQRRTVINTRMIITGSDARSQFNTQFPPCNPGGIIARGHKPACRSRWRCFAQTLICPGVNRISRGNRTEWHNGPRRTQIRKHVRCRGMQTYD